jgi:hypothetical protein
MLTERQLDRLCWLVLDWRERFFPPDETAEETIEYLEAEEDTIEVDDQTRGNEKGYHAGMFIAYDEIAEQLYCMGIDVESRAERYVRVNRANNVMLPETEYTFEASEHLQDHVDIESVGDAPYTIEHADNETIE